MTGSPGRTSARPWRLLAGFVAGILILAALAVGALRFAIAQVPENAARLKAWVERQTQLRIEYAALDARLRAFGPEIVLLEARVLDRAGEQAMFETREATIGLDLWGLFRTGKFLAGRVRFVEPEVTVVRLADGRIRLLGQRERPADRPLFDLDRLPAGRLEIVDATLHYRDLQTGRGPWTLGRVRLALQRDRDSVEVSGSARLPRELGTQLAFEGNLSGSLARLESLDAGLRLEVDRLALAGFADLLPALRAIPRSGDGPVSAMIAVSRGRLDQLRLETDLSGVVIDLPRRTLPPVVAVEISEPYQAPGSTPLSMLVADQRLVERPAPDPPAEARYARLAGSFRLRREGLSWTFRGSDVVTQQGGDDRAQAATFSGRWRGHPRSAFDLRVEATRVDLAEVWPLVLAATPPTFDRWAGLDPGGVLRELRAEVVRERAGSEPRFAVAGSVSGLEARPTSRWPGFTGLTASFSGTEARGRLALSAESPSFTWPRLFRAPITATRAQADVDWSRDGRAWLLRSPGFSISHPQAAAEGELGFRFSADEPSPVLDLDARVSRVEAALIPSVLPVGRLKPRTIVWLERAFGRGVATDGRVAYHGPVRRFPFRQGEGEFVATADVADASLDFFPGFAPLTGGAGTLEFRNASLAARVTRGSAGGLQLQSADLFIEDVKAPVLELGARARGDLANALAFLQGSPLGPQLGQQFMQLEGQGPAEFSFEMKLPTQNVAERDYTVRTTVNSATVSLPALRTTATQVAGELEIHNYDVRSRSLRGTILDGPFEVEVEPGPVGGDVTASVLVRGAGRAAGRGLPELIGLPDSIRMSGRTDWKLDGRLERRAAGEHWPARFVVTSDLSGLEIDAPRPFQKDAATPRPTAVTLEMPRKGRNDVRIESGAARGVLAFAAGAGGRWDLERGAARFDGQPLAMPDQPGLHVSGDWPEFDLAEWLALRSSQPGERRLSDWLGPVDVHLDRARVLGFEFSDVTARLQPQADAWRIDVSGPTAQGVVVVPAQFQGARPLTLDMQHLALRSGSREARPTRVRDSDPRELPALQARVEDLTWQDRRFGRVEATVERDPAGLRLTRLVTRSDAFDLSGRGSWLVEDDATRTRLQLEFSSDDLAAASRALGYRDAVDAERAHATADVRWSGGPSEDALTRMDGTIRLELDRGQLKGVKPGAGRMLGLLSVVELPRRLSLDFRDVTDEGLAFDTVRGDFRIESGNAYTDNLLLKGAAVDIGVVGRTGLASQDYDQTVIVSGNPSGPITVAGALAAGPVGAAGALLFSQLFKGQLQGLARFYYRVTGTWSDPAVERISAVASGNLAAGEGPPKEPRP